MIGDYIIYCRDTLSIKGMLIADFSHDFRIQNRTMRYKKLVCSKFRVNILGGYLVGTTFGNTNSRRGNLRFTLMVVYGKIALVFCSVTPQVLSLSRFHM